MKKAGIVIILLFTVGILRVPAFAYVMQGSNYRMQLDSVNFGGQFGSSTNYKSEDTLGEIATGYASGTTYMLHAGYQQMYAPAYIAISVPDSVALSPSIPGLTGGTASGTADVLVSTNNPIGYTLYIQASTTPAMRTGSFSFPDFMPASSTPDFSWSVAATSSAFGFSPKGADVVQKYKDNGSVCNSNVTQTAGACWDGVGTALKMISQSGIPSDPQPTTTTVNYKAESGNQHLQPSGHYSATIIMTAVAN